jgi:hypothetical protein
MYKIKGSHAYSHGCYIRPGEYVTLWREIRRQARELNISVSEFVSHSMHLFLMEGPAKYSKLEARRKKRKTDEEVMQARLLV